MDASLLILWYEPFALTVPLTLPVADKISSEIRPRGVGCVINVMRLMRCTERMCFHVLVSVGRRYYLLVYTSTLLQQ